MHHLKLGALRPSPSMAVAGAALFFALAGAGYAATSIPTNSIGNRQLRASSVANVNLRNNSVGNVKLRNSSVGKAKLRRGSVGAEQINAKQVQLAIKGDCTLNQAMVGVTKHGAVKCAAAGAYESNSGTGPDVSLTSATVPAAVASLSMVGAGLSYQLTTAPQITVTPEKTPTDAAAASEQVNVSCTLSAGPSSSTATTTIYATQGSSPAYALLPLRLVPRPANVNITTARLACTQASSDSTDPKATVAPTVQAQATIYAQTLAATVTAPTITTAS